MPGGVYRRPSSRQRMPRRGAPTRATQPRCPLNYDSQPASSPATLAEARRSACPGLVRVVAARDGGLCRIRLPGGVLSAAQARAIAHAARTDADGTLELTNRANVQIRGVRAGQEAALTTALIAGGLGPANGVQTPANLCAADELRNLMLSPLAGLDPHALFDTTTLAAPLVAMLQNEPRFAALSPKFALLIDGGESLAALDHPHDIWLAATREGDATRFAFGLAGCPDDGATGSIAATHVQALIRALLHAFLDLAAPDQLRMRDVIASHGAAALLDAAQRHADFAIPTPQPAADHHAPANWQRPRVDLTRRLGAHALHANGDGYVGAQPPLARLDAATLDALADLAERHGDATLRITPWQGALVPHVARAALMPVLDALRALGLSVDAADPLARTIACTGSAGCAKSRADTKADALRLAPHLPPHVQAHLSGCERSCAAAHRAPFTLLAAAPAHYDLYERDASAAGFGRLVARHLTLDAAAHTIAQRAPEPF